MKKCSKIISLALCVITMFTLLAACKKEANEIKNENVLRVGMECAYAPFNWTQQDDSNGAVKIESGGYAGGYDVEIAKKIAAELGKELVIVKTEWDGLTAALTSGKIDLIIAGMSATEERKQTIDFSDNYYKSELVIVTKKDSKFASAKTINDFSGAKITGQLNTFHYSVIDQMKGVDKQNALEDFPTMIVAVQSGKIDGYVSELPGAISAVASNPDLTYVEFNDETGFKCSADDVAVAVGIKKGSDLTEKVNAALAKVSEEERLEIMNTAVQNQPANQS